jgi:hypothetical protein
MRISRPYAALVACAWLIASCGDAGPDAVVLKDPVALTAQVAAVRHSFATPPLQSLGAIAPFASSQGFRLTSVGLGLNGTTYEWDAPSQTFKVTARPGAPADAVRLILYASDSATGRPALPLVENGYLDVFQRRAPTGVPTVDSSIMRFVVTDIAGAAVADFVAHREDTYCRCAQVGGWTNDGVTRVDFAVSYRVFYDGGGSPGAFDGEFTASPPSLRFSHSAGLPSYDHSVRGFGVSFAFQGDTIGVSGGVNRHVTGLPNLTVFVNGQGFAGREFTSSGNLDQRADGRPVTAAERAALDALYALPHDFMKNIDLVTYYIFYRGHY